MTSEPVMTDETAPRRLGSTYVLETPLGTGAQGQVWSGRHLGTGEVLAFKVLRAEVVDSPGVVDRFIKERSTLLRVRSPFVVAIRDVVIEGSTFAIVMDYVGGGDLRDLLRAEGTVPPGQVAALGSGIAQGLAAVHQAGVVHRDIKPANILLDRSPRPSPPASGATQGVGEDGGTVVSAYGAVTPRLGDFGVAHICDTLATGHLTGAIGTPLYMAPEILSAQPPTAAADIYSLGIVLYQMLCGTPPFTGQPPQLLAQHARWDPGRPAGVPDPLWGLISAMVSKQPGYRPGVQEVVQGLEGLRAGLAGLPAAPLLAEPPPTTASAMPYDWDAGARPAAQPSSASAETGLTVPAGAGSQAPTVVARTAPTLAGQLALLGGGSLGGAQVPPDGAQPPSAAAPPGGRPEVPGGSAAASPQVPAGPGPAGAGGRPRRGGRRRRWWALVAVIVVVVLAAAGTGGFLWWRARAAAAYEGWLAALPQGDSVQEDLRISDISAAATSPGGDLLAVRSSSFDSGDSDWQLYDLTRSTATPVWTGDCGLSDTTAFFWDDTTMLCYSSNPVLVARDGSTSAPPTSQFQWIGASTERAVVIAGDRGSGDLVAYSSQGAEAWRIRGDYDNAGMVRNGYVIVYENDLNETQVILASTGKVLTSVKGDRPHLPSARTNSFPDTETDPSSQYPAGFNIFTGTEAFSRVADGEVTIYDADGNEVQTVSGSLPLRNDFATSVPMDAQALAAAYTTSAKDPSATYAFGPDGDVSLEVDTEKCVVTANGKELEIPARASGEDCVIRPLGGLRGDLVLLQVGEPSTSSSATGDSVIAFSLSDGKPAWQVRGTLVHVVPNASGGGDSRLLIAHTGSSRVDAVVVSVAS